MLAHPHFSATPAPSPVGTEAAGDLPVEIKDEFGRQRLGGEGAGGDFALNAQDLIGQQRSQLAVAQEPAACLDVAGGAAWRCSVWSHETSTGSCSKAMDRLTCRGMRSQRMRCRVSADNCRQ